MAEVTAKLKQREQSISAVVTRVKRDAAGNPIVGPDGKFIVDSVEDLGTISYYNANPFKMAWWYLCRPHAIQGKIINRWNKFRSNHG